MEEALSDLKKVLRALVVSSRVQLNVRSLLKDYREMVGGRLPIEQYGYRNPVNFLKECCSDSFQFHGPPNNPILKLIVPDSIKHIDRFVRAQKISPAAKVKGKRRSVLGTPSNPTVSKPSEEYLIYMQRVLFQVKANINKLVSSYPEGVWCTDLFALYKERFGTELNFNKFGYTSLVSLVLDAGDEIAVTRPNPSDWLLQPASAVACQPKLPQDLQVDYAPWAIRRLAAPQSDEDALPGVAIEPGVFPADCVDPLASIEGVGVEGVAEGDLLEVMVTELYSPSRFWVQRLGERHNLALEELMDEMNAYYNGAGAERRLCVGAVRVGHHVTCRFEGDWHRAVIVQLVVAGGVKVRHVDYGTVCAVRTAKLRPLLRRFAALPAQAIRVVLAGVQPVAGGRRWPLAASSFLLSLVSDRQLVARVCAVCSASATLELQLIDTSGEDDVYLAERLLRAGHADPAPFSALASDEGCLLPTFEALEGGHTLNFSDIHQCLRDGINIELLDEYRCHVAPLDPSSPPISSPPLPAPTPPLTPMAPPERDLSPEVYKRFLALSMVDSTITNEYMVDDIMRAQVQVDSRSPAPPAAPVPVSDGTRVPSPVPRGTGATPRARRAAKPRARRGGSHPSSGRSLPWNPNRKAPAPPSRPSPRFIVF